MPDTAHPAGSPFPLGRPARIAVFASGRGSNLASLLADFPPPGAEVTAAAAGDELENATETALGNVVLVVSNVPGAPVLAKAEAAGVPTLQLPWRSRAGFEAAAIQALEQHQIDLICLAGFMRLLSAEFTGRYRGRLLNVHPSLLPHFPGLAAPQQAVDAGVTQTGCTVHFVDAGVDTGAVIVQRRVRLYPNDDAKTLAARILHEEELAYPEAIRRVLTGVVAPHIPTAQISPAHSPTPDDPHTKQPPHEVEQPPKQRRSVDGTARRGAGMKVLLVGSGAREHAIAWALTRPTTSGPAVSEVVAAPGNDGMRDLARVVGGRSDLNSLLAIAELEQPDLVVIGPEAPLVEGLADALREHGMTVFGPSKDAARLEGSKAFAKRFMLRHGVPTASFSTFTDEGAALAHLGSVKAPVVVKDSGLAAGKGVTVAQEIGEARAAVKALFEQPGAEVVIEECLVGRELTLMLVTDGRDYHLLPVAQDYKHANDGNTGPMTGGMGAVAPIELKSGELDVLVRTVVEPVLSGIRAEGLLYRGVLYLGLMLTASGPKLLEFNVRFGDPEAQVVLPLLDSNAAELFLAVASGRLAQHQPRWSDGSAVCVVLAAPGYPGKPQVGIDIALPTELPANVHLFHAGTRDQSGQLVSWGGRVLSVVARAADRATARELAYSVARSIEFPGAQLRNDVAG